MELHHFVVVLPLTAPLLEDCDPETRLDEEGGSSGQRRARALTYRAGQFDSGSALIDIHASAGPWYLGSDAVSSVVSARARCF